MHMGDCRLGGHTQKEKTKISIHVVNTVMAIIIKVDAHVAYLY